MTNQQSDQNRKTKEPTEGKQSKPSKPLSTPKPGSPMDKFNNAMRKILSVPKKNVKK